MKAVILAAGRGTRLRPLTYTKAKCLLPLANKPIIQYIVEDLLELRREGAVIDEIDEIFIVTNYLEDKLKAFFREWSPSVKLTFVHQRQLGGTGDALNAVAGMIDEDFIMVNGDEVFGSGTFAQLLNTFHTKDASAVVAAFESDTPELYGTLITDSTGALKDILEKSPKPTSNLVNAGAYVFSPIIFDYLKKIGRSERGEYELTDAIVEMAESTANVFAYRISNWQGVSMLWDMFEANKMKIKERLDKENDGDRILVGKDVKIKPGVYIEGNIVIGDNSVIGPNCYLRGDTSIGSNCHIGAGVEIKNSIIMDNSNVPHLSYIGDSIIGSHCNMGAGTISANLRHDYRNVKVLVKGKVVESNRHKIGFFAADWTKTGIGTMIYPGMLLGPFSWTTPNATVDCNVEPFTMLGPAGKTKISKGKIGNVAKSEADRRFLEWLYEELKDVNY